MTTGSLVYRVKKITFPSSGERFVVVDGPPDGIAIESTSIYTSMRLRELGLSPNSMSQHLSAVALLLRWAASHVPAIDLNARLESVQLLSTDEILSLRRELRRNLNVGRVKDPEKLTSLRPTVRHGHYYFRCHAVRDFVVWHAQRAIDRIQTKEIARLQEYRFRLDIFRERMTGDLASPRERHREGVGENVQAIFLEAIRPGSDTNPFQLQHQARNHALLLLYHVHGPRKSDPLKLKGEDLHLHGNEPSIEIVVRYDELADPRRHEPRHKTFGRPLKLGPKLTAAISDYVLIARPNYPNAKRSPYVFLARNGKPLSLAAVDDMFRLLRRRVPGLPPDFTCHITRHNAVDRFGELAKKLGWTESEHRRNENFQFGWSKTSTQGDRYRLRGVREAAGKALLAMQMDSTG